MLKLCKIKFILLLILLSAGVLYSQTVENTEAGNESLDETKIDFLSFIGIYNAGGYHVPIGDWWSITTGLMNVETGIKFVRLPAMVDLDHFDLSFRPGLVVSYSLGINKPGLNEFYYHSLIIRLPVDLLFTIHERFVPYVSVGIQAHIDMYYYSRYRGDFVLLNTAAFGVSAGAGFEYLFGKKKVVGLGFNNVVDFAFYDVFGFDYKVQLTLICRLKGKSGSHSFSE